MEVEGTETIGGSRGPVVKGGTGPPLTKCARVFLTGALGSADVDVRGLGGVLKDGNVTCGYSRKMRERTGYLEKLRRNLPVMFEHHQALNTNRSLRLARTPVSPQERSRKHDLGQLAAIAGESRGSLPSILVLLERNSVMFVRCCKTQMSPAKVRGKFVKGNWLPWRNFGETYQ